MLADMKVKADAARMLVWRAGWLKDQGKPNTLETSIAKLYATEAAVECANTAIQVHGGAGYVDDHPVERWFRDVRVTTLYEGTSQIQKLIIGRALTGINALVPDPPQPVAAPDDRRSSAPARWAPASRSSAARPARRRCCSTPTRRRSTRARERIAAGHREGGREGPRAADALERLRARRRRSPSSRGCDVVIEAVPEDLALKHRVLRRGRGGRRRRRACWRRTRRRSRSPQVAAGVPGPERVVGMHFFNPAPVMKLVEVIAGVAVRPGRRRARRARSARRWASASSTPPTGPASSSTAAAARSASRRCGCLQEGMADVETIDRIVRLGGGFRMGPFELQDLVGIDVGFEVSQVVLRAVVRRAALAPVAAAARMAASGRHGRKTGRGWYDVRATAPHRPDDPEPPPAGGGDGLIVVAGDSLLAERAASSSPALAGWDVAHAGRRRRRGAVPRARLRRATTTSRRCEGAPQALLCDRASLAALEGDGPAVGFHALPPLERRAASSS